MAQQRKLVGKLVINVVVGRLLCLLAVAAVAVAVAAILLYPRTKAIVILGQFGEVVVPMNVRPVQCGGKLFDHQATLFQ